MSLKKAFAAVCLCAGLMGPSSSPAPSAASLTCDALTDVATGNSRALTAGEIAMARSIFGNSIDYEQVRISRRDVVLTKKEAGLALGNTIFFAARYEDDYAAAHPSHRRLLVHELAHVWQSQNRVQKMMPAMIGEWVSHGFQYSAAYRYELDVSKDLTDYRLEQQATIIEDYFDLREGTMDYFADLEKRKLLGSVGKKGPRSEGLGHEELRDRHCAKIIQFESVLANFLADPSYARDWARDSADDRDRKRATWPRPPAP
jgi:hypothetical protein